MATRKPISLTKKDDHLALTWPEEPSRFTEDHVDAFLLWAVKQGSSDITLQTDRPVYNDIHGTLYPGTQRALDAADMAVLLQKIYGPEAQARLASAKDLDVSYEIRPDRYTRIRFRVNITAILSRGRDSAQITMRTLPSEPPKFEDLGIEQAIIENWAPRQGMVVVTGPTGSGKSTLMAAGNRMLLERPGGCGKMLTYESPTPLSHRDHWWHKAKFRGTCQILQRVCVMPCAVSLRLLWSVKRVTARPLMPRLKPHKRGMRFTQPRTQQGLRQPCNA